MKAKYFSKIFDPKLLEYGNPIVFERSRLIGGSWNKRRRPTFICCERVHSNLFDLKHPPFLLTLNRTHNFETT